MSSGSLGELGEDVMASLACELLLLQVGVGKEKLHELLHGEQTTRAGDVARHVVCHEACYCCGVGSPMVSNAT